MRLDPTYYSQEELPTLLDHWKLDTSLFGKAGMIFFPIKFQGCIKVPLIEWNLELMLWNYILNHIWLSFHGWLWLWHLMIGLRWLSKRVWRDPKIKHVAGEHRCLLDDDDDDDDGANKTFVTIWNFETQLQHFMNFWRNFPSWCVWPPHHLSNKPFCPGSLLLIGTQLGYHVSSTLFPQRAVWHGGLDFVRRNIWCVWVGFVDLDGRFMIYIYIYTRILLCYAKPAMRPGTNPLLDFCICICICKGDDFSYQSGRCQMCSVETRSIVWLAKIY